MSGIAVTTAVGDQLSERSPTSGSSSQLRFGTRTLLTVSWIAVTVGGLILLAGVWLVGWRLEVIATDSMSPAIPRGSVTVVTDVAPDQVMEGEVIVFRDPSDRSRRKMHRVVEVVEKAGSTTSTVFFRTKGDANATPDVLLAPQSTLEGRVLWDVPWLGRLLWWLRPPVGLLVLAGFPLAHVFVEEARRRRGTGVGMRLAGWETKGVFWEQAGAPGGDVVGPAPASHEVHRHVPRTAILIQAADGRRAGAGRGRSGSTLELDVPGSVVEADILLCLED